MPPTIDATSDEIVAHYTGDGTLAAAGAPARDLTHNDIARLAYQREISEVGDMVGKPADRDDPDSRIVERPDPRKPKAVTVKAILAELDESGRYRIDSGKTTKSSTPDSTADAADNAEA
jgi:hypothetical protein